MKILDLFSRIRRFFCRPSSVVSGGFSEDFPSWEIAKTHSKGWADNVIFDRVKAAAHLLHEGKVVYERDSVVFEETQYSWGLLAGFLYSAIGNDKIDVVDFGGAFGSTFFQNRKFFAKCKVSWNIIEQPHVVEYGRKCFCHGPVHFFFSLSEALSCVKPQVIIFSSVLPYIENPYKVLAEAVAAKIPVIIVDRTSFHLGSGDRIKIQRVPKEIYLSSFPIRFFEKKAFLNRLEEKYELMASFPSIDLSPSPDLAFEGMIWRLK